MKYILKELGNGLRQLQGERVCIESHKIGDEAFEKKLEELQKSQDDEVIIQSETLEYVSNLKIDIALRTNDYWKSYQEEDLEFGDDSFPMYEGVDVNILGKLQAGELYEAIHGPGTFTAKWYKKDRTQADFDLNTLWLFGFAVAERKQTAIDSLNLHLKAINAMDSSLELKSYDFTIPLTP